MFMTRLIEKIVAYGLANLRLRNELTPFAHTCVTCSAWNFESAAGQAITVNDDARYYDISFIITTHECGRQVDAISS